MRDRVLAAIDDALLEEVRRRFISASDRAGQGGTDGQREHFRTGLGQLKEFHAVARQEAAAIFEEKG